MENMLQGKVRCRGCGALNAESDAVCVSCGQSLSTTPAPKEQPLATATEEIAAAMSKEQQKQEEVAQRQRERETKRQKKSGFWADQRKFIIPLVAAIGAVGAMFLYYMLFSPLIYTVSDQSVVIDGCRGAKSEIKIPARIKGRPVTSIGEYAFVEYDSVTSVTLPDSVTSIGDGAFFGCSNLTSVTIPNGTTSIGFMAFIGCNNVTLIVVPGSLTEQYAKENGFSYKAIQEDASADGAASPQPAIPDGMTVTNGTITGMTLPEGVIGVTVPDGVTSIGDGAFYGNASLTRIVLSNSVTSIGKAAFWGCDSLTSVILPNSITSIGDGAFGNCASLASVTIPNSVTSIGYGTFANCTSLANVTLPNSVTSIDSNAFENCTQLTLTVTPGSMAEKYAQHNRIYYEVMQGDVSAGSASSGLSTATGSAA